MWRIGLDQELVIVVGRNRFEDWNSNEQWIGKFAQAVAESIAR